MSGCPLMGESDPSSSESSPQWLMHRHRDDEELDHAVARRLEMLVSDAYTPVESLGHPPAKLSPRLRRQLFEIARDNPELRKDLKRELPVEVEVIHWEYYPDRSQLPDFLLDYVHSNDELLILPAALREPPAFALRTVDLASAVDVEPDSRDEWRAHLQELAATGSKVEIVRFVAGIVRASLCSRLGWLVRQAAAPGVNVLCWVLRSEVRTWAVLSGLLLWAGVETADDTGIGAAILLVLVAFSGLVWLVEWLRDRFGAHPLDKTAPPGPED